VRVNIDNRRKNSHNHPAVDIAPHPALRLPGFNQGKRVGIQEIQQLAPVFLGVKALNFRKDLPVVPLAQDGIVFNSRNVKSAVAAQGVRGLRRWKVASSMPF
jgi:hypothetical protein